MRRMITVYAILISVVSGFAILSLSGLSVALLEHWNYLNPEDDSLHSWTINSPNIARAGLMIPGLLFVVAILSLKLKSISDRVLVHGICLTALALAAIAVFVIAAGMMPSIVTITEMH